MKVNRKIALAGIHILGWILILIIPSYLMRSSRFQLSFSEIVMWFPVAMLFYLNYYILIPKLLMRRKFALYASSLFIIFIISFFSVRMLNRYFLDQSMLASVYAPTASSSGNHLSFSETVQEQGKIKLIRRKLDIFVLCILSIAVGTSIKVTGQWYSNEKERKEMENEKLSAELSFLKSQINPHFFFNTLNSIYSLAMQKSGKTPEAIVKLSELMRYIIYESDKPVVPLKKELEYIKNYVELQQLRLTSNVKIFYDIAGIPYADIMIEPLLFLPFIENAFKHGIDPTLKCEIKIKFAIATNHLNFMVENPIIKQSKNQPSESSGIGLMNSKKRLQLLYQNKHDLKVTQNNDSFRVELSIKTGNDELHHS